MKSLLFAVIGPWLMAGAVAAAPIDDLLTQVQCAAAPDPIPVIRGLLADGTISSPEYTGYDSVSCWPVADGVMLLGTEVAHVCASVHDAEAMKANADLFWRGPGTAPPTSISLTSLDVTQKFRTAAGDADIRPHPVLDGETEAYCDSF